MTSNGYDISSSLTNWRQANTASGLLEQLCMSGTLADVYFVFPSREGQQDSLPAHKFVLAMRSPVFETLFFGPDSEKQASEIIVRDVRATTFRTLLRYRTLNQGFILVLVIWRKIFKVRIVHRRFTHLYVNFVIDLERIITLYRANG